MRQAVILYSILLEILSCIAAPTLLSVKPLPTSPPVSRQRRLRTRNYITRNRRMATREYAKFRRGLRALYWLVPFYSGIQPRFYFFKIILKICNYSNKHFYGWNNKSSRQTRQETPRIQI